MYSARHDSLQQGTQSNTQARTEGERPFSAEFPKRATLEAFVPSCAVAMGQIPHTQTGLGVLNNPTMFSRHGKAKSSRVVTLPRPCRNPDSCRVGQRRRGLFEVDRWSERMSAGRSELPCSLNPLPRASLGNLHPSADPNQECPEICPGKQVYGVFHYFRHCEA